jgi:hypothetical protein
MNGPDTGNSTWFEVVSRLLATSPAQSLRFCQNLSSLMFKALISLQVGVRAILHKAEAKAKV